MSEDNKPKDSAYQALGIYGAIGFQLAASVVGGLYLGNWLDGYFDTKPWLALLGLTLGAVGGFVNMIRLLNWKSSRNE